MNYELKEKIPVTKEFIGDLEMKGWQEIEYLQTQIANLDASSENAKLIQLLKNLLTSYYVFTGGVEALLEENDSVIAKPVGPEEQVVIPEVKPIIDFVEPAEPRQSELTIKDLDDTAIDADYEESEPFEYFVDFDEPFGEPLTDEDLYGKNK